MADLVVELYGTRAGILTGTWRTFDFLPDEAAITRFVLLSSLWFPADDGVVNGSI